MSEKATGARPDPESLRTLLQGLKELPPKVRTSTRRELRTVGDDVIAGQRAILDGPLPRGVRKAGWRHVMTRNRRTGKTYMRKVNVYRDADVKRPGRSTGLREAIKSGLKTRIVTGKTRQELEVRTTGPKTGSPPFNGAKFWNKKRFRHPVFGREKTYVDQAGQPYFRAPVIAGRDDMLRRAEQILRDAADLN